ncbi:Rne/Rng family ribonuclease [Palleronia caenipelagi]|uniref:Ribonuclease E n=1 Tax=Palleronia caenipelagi TaxID=2489174 RepID=A0A547PMC1_9RHOB|nr:ribonuclease E/G [Palleronia caenipelagi]TRD15301.1 Rne/Rng family ribonuclease [Palleronia caenipelagi]
MSKKMLIDATHAEETRVVVVDGNKVDEFDFESANKRQISGNIYLAKVTRVEPSLQAAFVDYGGNRHGFLAFSEIHPDYYQIPVADRQALIEEEQAEGEAEAAREDEDGGRKTAKPRRRSRSRSRAQAEAAPSDDAVVTAEPVEEAPADASAADETDTPAPIAGMDIVDPDGDDPLDAVAEIYEDEPKPYVAADEAAQRDSSIESVADDDVTDEVRRPKRARAKRYKIQEVIKVRQILLVQVVKEERGNKGAALTTYLSLAGRYCVLMPNTARGGGISRKITNITDRKKLKDIAASIDVPKGAGLIIRTAGAKRTKTEIKRDYEYLQRMWEQIRELTMKSIAPAVIYEEGNLIKRSIRDLYNREIDEVLVEGAEGYRTAKDFMKMIMPSHAKNVRHYQDQLPLFARHQVESYLGAMFNPTVQLPSGGYIVIGVTEALVAIDVNSGRATKEGSIEETAYKTNLEAAEEVARQLRLRDLAGLIVIDFIDMEERKHNSAVEKHFKDKLKNDRARIQVGKISAFGLLEMSRQRLRPGMLEASTQPCPHCHGTGLLRSNDSVALAILRQLEEEGTRQKTREVCVTAPVAIANYLINHKRDHIAMIEARYGMAIRIEADPTLISPDFKIEKLRQQTIRVVEQTAAITSTSVMEQTPEPEDEVEEETDEAEEEAVAVETSEEADDTPRKKRRRRRRKKRSDAPEDQGAEAGSDAEAASDDEASSDSEPAAGDETPAEADAASDAGTEEKPKRRRSRSRSRSRKRTDDNATEAPAEAGDASETADAEAEAGAAPDPVAEPASAPVVEEAPEPKVEGVVEAVAAPEPVAEAVPEPEAPAEPAPAAEPAQETPAESEAPAKPKRRGWWAMRG